DGGWLAEGGGRLVRDGEVQAVRQQRQRGAGAVGRVQAFLPAALEGGAARVVGGLGGEDGGDLLGVVLQPGGLHPEDDLVEVEGARRGRGEVLLGEDGRVLHVDDDAAHGEA